MKEGKIEKNNIFRCKYCREYHPSEECPNKMIIQDKDKDKDKENKKNFFYICKYCGEHHPSERCPRNKK